MTLRFGTDGVRGVANADLVPELVVALGRAAGRVFSADRLLVGRDPRRSGPMVQSALAAGLMSEGVDVVDLGVLPTAGVAWMSAAEGLPAAMISASHNPFGDNGIKFFASGGRKLTDEMEERLEAELDALLHGGVVVAGGRPTGTGVGALLAGEGVERYAAALVATVGAGTLDGVYLVLDCANGAASEVAPEAFRRAGARVAVINASPDGCNINAECGSTFPAGLAAEVVRLGADAGLAFDGDADRALAVDASGNLVDGDQMIALLAIDRRSRQMLPGDTVVVTVMTNLGFRHAMAGAGIQVVETAVGDRAVLEALESGGWGLGGEQSGHLIFPELATTGDGILTALQVVDVMVRTGRPLAELAGVMARLPQVLQNVTLPPGGLNGAGPAIAELAAAASDSLGDRGRVLVRPSGTEPVVRVMVEAETPEAAEAACAALCDQIRAIV